MTGDWSTFTEETDPRLHSAYAAEVRAAYRTLLPVVRQLYPPSRYAGFCYTEADEEFLPYVLGDLKDAVRYVAEGVEAELGVPMSWPGPDPGDGWAYTLRVLVVDTDDNWFDDPEDVWAYYDSDGFPDSPLDRAGVRYKRECGWDFSPGEGGVWVVAVAPHGWSGGEESGSYGGYLVSFVVVYDRDKDGEYESIGHLWTASAWRRRGIARALVTRARELFPITTVEGPYTADGKALLAEIAPELM
jgi:ribosomal protein S18 acetylase RimI-like enzyme